MFDTIKNHLFGTKKPNLHYYETVSQLEDGKDAENFATLKRLADEGYAEAQFRLADMYVNGVTDELNRKTRRALYEKAAQQGHVTAMTRLARDYQYSPMDIDRALFWGRKAYQIDKINQPFYLEVKRLKALQKQAERGDAQAQFEWAKNFSHNSEDKETYVKWLTKAAEQGHLKAQLKLANHYYYAGDAYQTEAAKWYEKAGHNGAPEGQFFIAKQLYADGKGSRDNKTKAMQWLEKAKAQGLDDYQFSELYDKLGIELKAKSGDAEALYQLGLQQAINFTSTDEEKAQAIDYFKRASEQGHTGACYQLGVSYEYVDDYDNRYERSIPLIRKAAEAGDAQAQYDLARRYSVNDRGVKQNLLQTFKWMKKAAMQQHPSAEEMYEELLERKYDELVATYPQAENGDKDAQCEVARLLYRYIGDTQSAIAWYEKAASQGYGVAHYELARLYQGKDKVPYGKSTSMYFHGYFKLENAEEKACAHIQHAADLGYDKAQFEHAEYLRQTGDRENAVKWYQLSADQDYAPAQFRYGLALMRGDCVAKDLASAKNYLQQSAEQGNSDGQCAFAQLIENEDREQAIQWYQAGAKKLHPESLLGLAKITLNDDAEQAFKLCRQSAYQGLKEAQYFLATLYAQGSGVAQDAHLSAVWLVQSAVQGHKPAAQMLSQAYRQGNGVARSDNMADYWEKYGT